MTFPSVRPPSGDQVTDYYEALGPLLRMAWGDNLHFGYWEGPSDASSPQEATDRFTDLLAARLRVGPGDRVLDAGCGIGRPALRIAAVTGAEVLGITISRQQVEQAVALAGVTKTHGRVAFEYADAMHMPYEDGSFDAVLALESIVHMDRPTALREMGRVVKPGGHVVLTDTFPLDDAAGDAESARNSGDAGDVASMTRLDAYPDQIADAGLELVELTDVTEHTRFTFARVVDGIIRCRREFERQHGITVEEVLDSLKPAHPEIAAPGGAPQVGCLVAVARRPAGG